MTSPQLPFQNPGSLRRFISGVGYVITSPYRAFKFLCFSIGFFVLSLGIGVGTYAVHFFHSLPQVGKMDFNDLRKLAQRKTLRRQEDKTRSHHWVEIASVNRNFLYSVVMSEDSTFFEHGGINYDAIVNSAIMNFKKKKYEYGASTISQQVVKNLFLSDEKSLTRKAKEMLITSELEKHFTKNQILEIYLNIAELGPDIFGIQRAAQHYFKKSPQQINAAEGAFIALMLPSPRKLHFTVFENRNLSERNRKKLRRVLADLHANDYISTQQYREYLSYDYFGRRAPASSRH